MNPNTPSRISETLQRCTLVENETVPLLCSLVDALRPKQSGDTESAIAAHGTLLALLEQHPQYRQALRERFRDLLEKRRLVSFFSGSGMLPDTGFFTELWRITVSKVLPEAADDRYLRDAMQVIFSRPDDHVWIDALPANASRRLWDLLELCGERSSAVNVRISGELLRAALVVCHRISAMGLSREFVRSYPQLEDVDSPFIALGAEMHQYAAACEAVLYDAEPGAADEKHLLVLLDQCREAARRASAGTMMRGTSLDLNFLLVRLSENIERLELLVRMASTRLSAQPAGAPPDAWSRFMHEALRGENKRNNLGLHWSRLTGMLALRVTQNAGRTGEHYITDDRAGYFSMLRSAGGAGVIIGVMALLKIFASKLDLAPLPAAFVYSLNYAIGFMVVHILHFTIATKQPAMTASAIAATISDNGDRLRDVDKLAALVINVLRSQFAAICGNILVAFPVALVIGAGLSALSGGPLVTQEKAAHLLHDLSPFSSPALLHAAIAGVWLFLAWLISGYFDNAAAYHRIPERVARAGWLNRLLGKHRTSRVAAYLDDNLGGLAGNFFFGFMLGCTALAGVLLGANIDIRHIAFASANLAYGMAGSGFGIPVSLFISCAVGVVLIGLVNLGVSFALALWVAMRAHGVRFIHSGPLAAAIIRQIAAKPLSLVWPPAAQGAKP